MIFNIANHFAYKCNLISLLNVSPNLIPYDTLVLSRSSKSIGKDE